MALVTDPCGATSDSLASLDDATNYLATVQPAVKAAWLAAGTDAQECALRQASMLMGELPWMGVRTQPTQALCWPRRDGTRLYDPLQPYVGVLYDRDGYPVNAFSIPALIVRATCEFALRLLGEDRIADAGALAPSELKIGTLSISGLQRRPIPASVLDMVAQFLRTRGFAVPLVRR
jgi:hypothetical protein